MKSFKEYQSKNQSEGDPNSRDLFKDLEIQCLRGKPGKLYCIDCDANAVMCDYESCPCHEVHSQCDYSQNIRILHDKLNSKVFKDYNPDKVAQKTRKLVDGIQKIQEQIKEEFTYFGLNSAEVEISKIIKKTSQGKKIKGSDLKRFKESRQNQKLPHFQDSLIKYKRLLQVSKINVMTLFNKLEQQIVEQHLHYYEKKVMSEILDSQIVKTPQELKTLNGMINPSLIFEQTEKIFAHYGENKMDMGKLREACENRSSLLFLIENNFGKKFGVYSEAGFEKKKKNLFSSSNDDLKPTCLFNINCDKSQTSDMKRIKSRSAYVYPALPSEPCLTFELFDEFTKRSVCYLKLNSQNCYYHINGQSPYNLNGVGENPVDWGKCYRKIKSVEVFQVSFDKPKKIMKLDDQKDQKVQNPPKVQKKNNIIFDNACQIPKKKEQVNLFSKKPESNSQNIFSKNPALEKQRILSNFQKQSQNNNKNDEKLSQNSDGALLGELFKSNEEFSNAINDQENANVEKRPKSQIRLFQNAQQTKQQNDSIKLHKFSRFGNIFGKVQSSELPQTSKTPSIFNQPQPNIFGNKSCEEKFALFNLQKSNLFPTNIFGHK